MLANFAEIVERGSRDEALLARVDWSRLPRHVAIIMDGNGRWAARRGQQRIAGHRAGVEAVRSAVDTGARLGLRALTLYAFSTENWKRPRLEVDEIRKQNIRSPAIGRTEGLPASVQRELERGMVRTSENTGMVLSVALNYGGRAEIVDAVRAAGRELAAQGRAPEEVTEADIERHLYTAGLPELDLLVRTSGELRISNFLLWQAAYSEIYVTETLWPDFRRAHLLEAVVDFQRRDRRFGGLKLVANSY